MSIEKATEEVAKAVQQLTPVADKHAERLEGFLHKVVGAGLEHLGGAFSDWAASFRYRNAIQLMDRVDAIHRERGVTGKTVPIPPRLGIPLLERATLEDDDTLSTMWAALTANALDPSRHVEARRGFTELLSSLEPIDAVLLQTINQYRLEHPDRQELFERSPTDELAREYWPNVEALSAKTGLPIDAVAMAIENLERLALVFDKPLYGGSMITAPTNENATLDLTNTGRALLAACAR